MTKLAILAGSGQLAVSLAAAYPNAFLVSFDGMQSDVSAHACVRFEHLGSLFERLHQEGITKIVMAGAMSRPSLNPSDFDAGMAEIAPRRRPWSSAEQWRETVN